MADNTDDADSLAEFRDSFFYGSRSNLNVKFLARLNAEQAGDVIADMFAAIGGLLDHGNPGPVIDEFIRWQRTAYRPHDAEATRFTYDDGPFTPVTTPLAESRVALVTSSGHFVDGDDPEPFGVTDMSQSEAEARIGEFLRAEPTLSGIPVDTPADQLRVRHGGYPIEAVLADHQVALPIGHLTTLAARGVIGAVAPRAYSFVGATSQLRLRDRVAPEWAETLREDDVDLAVFVPV
ncbi:MAG: glycine/sarcosine/betaine reductase selenoprotein B family protein [Acidimicrobiia bacterium]